MYNRYIPQPDGTYRRNRVQEPNRQGRPNRPSQHPPEHISAPPEPCPEPEPIPCPQPEPRQHNQESHPKSPFKQDMSIGNFLKQLLPKDFDTGDLLIVLLLLLMAGDCDEDKNTAMLTLVLYLFL